ncbi:DUF2092 domain-containing protein [Terracidiphilus gabretensis]|uniref:DUF2092 domain-containing protein n=1 Tax=Terracidiphilus gabretensis TaxID=1577687 RepID=UPI00071B894B|nr:DUF2092 domain-containing protein [Terracidiphilus gabretensis]
MYRIKCASVVVVLALLAAICPAQDKPAQDKKTTSPTAPQAKDIDPLAMRVLKAVSDPLENAKAFRFKALVSEEDLATDGQIVTFFHTVDVTVQRPDKIHLVLRGRGQRVDFYTANGQTTMWSPDTQLYTTLPAKSTIDEDVASLRAKGIDMPIGPFLRSDFYQLADKAALTAYVIGRVKIYDQDVHQLVFTAADADYQLWVTGGDTPRFVRSEIVNKKLDGKPRTTIQFLDWDFNPTLDPNEFTFSKTSDAHEITLLPTPGGK